MHCHCCFIFKCCPSNLLLLPMCEYCASAVQVECTKITRSCIFSPACPTFRPMGQELLSLDPTCQSTDTTSTMKASWALYTTCILHCSNWTQVSHAVASDPCDFRCSVPTIPLTPVCLCLRASALCAFYILHSSTN